VEDIMKKKRKSNIVIELINKLFGINILISVIVFSKTKDLKLTGVFFILFSMFIVIIIEYIKIFKRKKYLKSGIDVVDKMSGEEFEEFLYAHFQNLGYKVMDTPVSHDYGADLILKKDSVKLVLQAKRYKEKVGIKAVQEIVAAIKYYDANNGVVISNNFFTKNACNLAVKNDIELWDRNKLIEIMSKSNGKSIAENIKKENEEICPKCGHKLIIRTGKRGDFWGCTNFPKCRFTKNISI